MRWQPPQSRESNSMKRNFPSAAARALASSTVDAQSAFPGLRTGFWGAAGACAEARRAESRASKRIPAPPPIPGLLLGGIGRANPFSALGIPDIAAL